ncbi:MAG: hypothetical protein SGJ26_11290 [Nitrospirota bacterium]|nr:hypothetical protein [Nitrospirota bacterium]
MMPGARLKINFEIDDPEVVALFETAMRDVMVRGLPQRWCVTGPTYEVAALALKTQDGIFNIYICDTDFAVLSQAGDGVGMKLPFKSMSLAILLKAVASKKCGVEVPERLLREWSGQGSIDAEVKRVRGVLKAGVPVRRLDKGDARAVAADPVEHEKGARGWKLWGVIDDDPPPTPVSARLKMSGGEDPEVCVLVDDKEVMQLFFGSMLGLLTTPPRGSDKPFDSKPMGRLDLTLPEGVVQIEIHSECFRLLAVPEVLLGPSREFLFRSPTLAYLVDEFRASAGIARLSDEHRMALSGEAYLEARRSAMLVRIEKTAALRGALGESKPWSSPKERGESPK